MKIRFEKVGASPKDFTQTLDRVTLSGKLQKRSRTSVELEGELTGDIDLLCDRCGKNYTQAIDQPLKVTLSAQKIDSKDDLDIIEFLNGVIDIEYIVQSEIGAIEGAFHYCSSCDADKEPIEIEF